MFLYRLAAPNLRGRPKKKRAHFRKYERDHVYGNESEDDSNESVTSSEKSRSSPVKLKEKMKLVKPVPAATGKAGATGKRSHKVHRACSFCMIV